MMNLRQLVTINALVDMGLGIAFAMYGPVMLAFFGIPDLPGGDALMYWNVASFARLFGAALFGSGLLLWALRSLVSRGLPEQTRRELLFAMLIANAMLLFVAVVQQFSVWDSPAGWIAIAVFGLLVIAYGLGMAIKSGQMD